MPGTLRLLALQVLLPVAVAAQSKTPEPPLAGFVAQRINVMPVQLLRADSAALVTPAMWPTFRKELDDSIGSAISQRGIGKGWAYAADVARNARRNSAYVSDPYALGVQALRGAPIKAGDRITDPLASNLRGQIALGDTRYALVPIELYFLHRGTEQKAVLRLALVDGRSAVFVWEGDVTTDAVRGLTPAVVDQLAARVADLVVRR